ncbi:flagellar filament capping protein FliD [Pantoea ananatis]|uniref:Flagellar hook-associated protein 2 n=1 Tax=Pantoea ananas TaxID=553 RepID=A0A8A4KEC5_PANAN|nr:flagellar filament capping protein FliD [Pantoea ananatis]MDC7872124.1 flagellar filament capping protein FliD [Pantoea ananatis]QTC48457.1 flagellar filament capping protein FliD [Pantoea ananatis]
MPSISSLGAGTNLDLNGLYDKLEKAEQQRLSPLTKHQVSYKAKLTSWSILQTSLQKLQTATKALENSSSLASGKVTSTNTAFTPTLSNNTSAGTYEIDVSQLAKSQMLLSKAADSKTAQLGDTSQQSRTITITQKGTDKKLEVTLSKGQTSLSDIRDAINKTQGGVSASIIKADNGTYYLSLTSRDTGTANAMTVSTSDKKLEGYLGYDGNGSNTSNAMTQKVAAADAVISVNGVKITRSSNTITDAPEGVILKLNATTSKPETLKIEKDNSQMTRAVQDFVDAYNSFQTTVASQTKFTAAKAGSSQQNSDNGALAGDGALRNIHTRIRSLLSVPQTGGGLSLLSQIGITQDVSGKLTVDSKKLEQALNDKPESVTKLLSGDGKTTGFATQMGGFLTKVLDTKGPLITAQDGINASLRQLDKQASTVNLSIAANLARYKAQFTRLSSLVSAMNNTSVYLSQQFNKM